MGTGEIRFAVYDGNTTGQYYDTSGAGITLGNWFHVAIVREGTGTNQTKTYINGVVKGTSTISSTVFGNNTAPFVIGMSNANADYYGYLDEVRFSNNARWTAAFTAPTSEYSDPIIYSSMDSADSSEKGIQTYGDIMGRSILQGKTIRFNIGPAEKIQIDANGRLGIGTTTPDSTLHVIGGACIESTDSGCTVSAGDLKVGGSVNSVGVFKANNISGVTTTLNLRNSANSASCTVSVTGGLSTATTCN